MTDEELAAIKARAEAATYGGWAYDTMIPTEGPKTVQVISGWDLWDLAVLADRPPELGPDNREADAEFIAHAREDVPALLAEVERLQEAVRDLVTLAVQHTAEHHEGF